MKNTALLFLFVNLAFSAFAQNKTTVTDSMPTSLNPVISDSPTAKGKWLVGPALSFSSYNNDDGTKVLKRTSIGLQPEVGYFISDDLSVGLSLSFGMQKTKIDGVDENKSSSFYVLPSVRYYLPITSKFKFLGKFQVPFGSVKHILEKGNPIDEKTTNFGVQVIPGFTFFPSNQISIEMTLGSLYFDSSKTGDVKSNSFGLKILNDNDHTAFITHPTLGVKWHLGR